MLSLRSERLIHETGLVPMRMGCYKEAWYLLSPSSVHAPTMGHEIVSKSKEVPEAMLLNFQNCK